MQTQKQKQLRKRKKKKFSNENQGKQKKHDYASNRKKQKQKQRHRHIISEDYDIEDLGGNAIKNNDSGQNDDQRFNTEKHHKQQHKF